MADFGGTWVRTACGLAVLALATACGAADTPAPGPAPDDAADAADASVAETVDARDAADTPDAAPDAADIPDTADIPDIAETAADTAETVPDSAETAPDTAETAPDTAETVPDSAETAPDTAETVPDSAETAADTAETASDTAETAPDTAETAPDTAETAPDTAETAPDTAETAPDTAETAADTAETAPDSAETAADADPDAAADALDVPDAGADAADDALAADAADASDTATACDPAPCDDGNACTTDSCDASGCVNLAAGGTCVDGDACAEVGHCVGTSCVAASATAGSHANWVRTIGAGGLDHSLGAAVDGSGRVYLTGQFSATVDFGGAALDTSLGNNFVASYALDGSLRWVNPLCSAFSINAIAVDRLGNSYVVGGFVGACDVGGQSLQASGPVFEGLVVSFDSSGAFRWLRRGSDGMTGTSVRAVTCDAEGNVYWTGGFSGSLVTPGGTWNIGAQAGGYVVSADSSGAWRWGHLIGGDSGYTTALTLAVDPAGRVTAGGNWYGTVDFGSGGKSAQFSADGWLVGLEANGVWRWDRQLGAEYVEYMSLTADGAGNVYATGCFDTIGNFGAGPVAPGGGSHVWLASYDGNGGYRWSNPFAAFFPGIGLAIDATPGGDVAVAFSYTGAGVISGLIPSDGLAIAVFSSSGGLSWARGIGSAFGGSVASDRAGNVWFSGAFGQPADFGTGTLNPADSSYDVFLVRYGDACDDGDPCTLDACDAATGCSHTAISPCADAICTPGAATCWGDLAVSCDAVGLGYSGTPTACSVSGMTCTGGTCTTL